ncbi:hypothetical protein [Erythrobacter sp. HL-111]|uniref:hypothetical protein n=1 Tax=Erythrobacter sp. HL-111 TaxID=1798193 RepID=UPI0006DA2A2F|nr:hypothetical protein [Erythrobacter sp. HL-111]KPP92612.1 MAG: hypothetical protein HLUCCO15_07685 [Erythrobacteraceae bacterium HL-111]SDS94421.1 hypothetical protein SAMN04515621_2565 [Erythrobacter sp. HL-111]
MNPSVDDRLNSVLRALETVVLPALPATASLAQEQVMLAIGHIRIIQAQRDATPGFETGELDDLKRMAGAILALDAAPAACAPQRAALEAALEGSGEEPRASAERLRVAIDDLLVAARQAGEDVYRAALSDTILPLARERAAKDREWFAVMGFDIDLSAA